MAGKGLTMSRQDCARVLIPTTINVDKSYEQQLAYLKIIQSDEQLTKAQKAIAGGSIAGISLFGDYAWFSRERNKFFQQENIDLTVEQAERLASPLISANRDCRAMAFVYWATNWWSRSLCR